MPDAAASHSIVSGVISSRPIVFGDRLLAESVAALEQLEPAPLNDSAANEMARAVGGDFEQRLIVRAESLPVASSLREALRHVRNATGLMIFAAIALAAIGGAAASRAALGVPRDEPVNFFHVFAAVLGVQTLLLLAWLVMMLMPRSGAAVMSIGSLGGLVLRAGSALARRLHPERHYAAAVAGLSRTIMRGEPGRWTFSAISHALWLAFNVGCLVMIIFLLSTRQYVFAWETTILSAETYRPLTRAIAALPTLAGFGAPTEAQVDASRWPWPAGRAPAPEVSHAWSALLVGSVIVYGLGPRLLLLGLSMGQRRAARWKYRLDVERPEFARLRGAIEPITDRQVVDGESKALSHTGLSRSVSHAAARPLGLPAILGFELPPEAGPGNWPPRLHGVRWRDLGMADTREDRQRVLSDLAVAAEEPAALLVVCSLTTTPDRGVSAFLRQLTGSVSRSPALVLSGGQRLRDRGSGDHLARIEQRLEDWREVARTAGIPDPRVIEVDFDHLTHASASKLTAIIAQNDGSSPLASPSTGSRHLEEAFAIIVQHVGDAEARGAPLSDGDAAALHQAIARLYRDQPIDWRGMLQLPSDAASLSPAKLGQSLQSSAARFTDLLPARLRRSPRWLAAGAAAGALGCLAAAALISPVAIGALPVWSLIGAAISAAMQPSRAGGAASEINGETPNASSADVVRSAALFALVLELQGRGEAFITRVLDRTIPDGEPSLGNALGVERWLQELAHRFDIARAEVAA